MRQSVCRIRALLSLAFPEKQTNKKTLFYSIYSVYHFEVADAAPVHGIGDLIRLKSGDSHGPKYNERTQTSHKGELGASEPDTNSVNPPVPCPV